MEMFCRIRSIDSVIPDVSPPMDLATTSSFSRCSKSRVSLSSIANRTDERHSFTHWTAVAMSFCLPARTALSIILRHSDVSMSKSLAIAISGFTSATSTGNCFFSSSFCSASRRASSFCFSSSLSRSFSSCVRLFLALGDDLELGAAEGAFLAVAGNRSSRTPGIPIPRPPR